MTEKYAWEGKGLDEASASELYLWIDGHATLYNRQHIPIIKNLVAKKVRGTYNSQLAAKLFGYLAESGAKLYNKELGDGVERIPSYFTKKVRDAVAKELRDRFEEEWALRGYREYVPKKYQATKKPATKKKPAKSTTGGITSISMLRK